jgi:hypothetical protein
MKKFMFSAIAMMAFSLSSMGNTIEETQIYIEEDFVLVDCYANALMSSEALGTVLNWNSRQRYDAFAELYEGCVASGNCHNCLHGN